MNEAEALAHIERLLTSAGYQVTSQPVISGWSSLPFRPDTIANKSGEVLIIEVKVGRGPSSKVQAEAGTMLDLMQETIRRHNLGAEYVPSFGQNPTRVRAIMILVDGEASPSLHYYAQIRNLEVYSIKSSQLERVKKADSKNELLDLMRELFPAITSS